MTKDEAQSIVDECNEHIDLETEGEIGRACLDGWFTVEQLEAVVTLLRSVQPGNDQ